MVRLLITLVAAWSLVYLTGCATHGALPPDVRMETVTYEVFGMDCPGCHGGLEKNLSKIPGVVGATANWKAQTVAIRVAADQAVDPTEIEAAVKNSNFTMGKRVD